MAPQQRNIAIDMMKGIGILLMMSCHLVYTDGPVRQFVYSFLMPLFFILAGLFAKDISDISSFRQFSVKNAKRLLLPYFVTMLMLCAWGAIQAYAKHDISFFLRYLFSMMSASADGWNSQWGLIYAGPMWFLIALFVVREIFVGIQYICRYVHEKFRDLLILSISVALSVISVYVHPLLPSLPFCIMQAFTAIAFYAVGWYIHRHPMSWWVYSLCVITWPFAIIYGGVELESAYLAYYPLSFIGALGGTYAIYLLCIGIVNLRSYIIHNTSHIIHGIVNIPSPLAWCGMFSLPILCMHELEMYSDIMYSIKCRIPSIAAAMGLGKIVIAIVMTIIVINIPYIKKVYR